METTLLPTTFSDSVILIAILTALKSKSRYLSGPFSNVQGKNATVGTELMNLFRTRSKNLAKQILPRTLRLGTIIVWILDKALGLGETNPN